MNAILQHIVGNWKTTVSGILSAIIATGVYFAAVPTAVLQENEITQKEIFWATVVFGLAKVFLGLIQSDAKPAVTSSVTVETTTPVEPKK